MNGYHASPNTRRYTLDGLPHAAGAGLPAGAYTYGSAGDAGEGIDLPTHLRAVLRAGDRYEDAFTPGDTVARATLDVAVNHDSGFTPIPGILPGEKHLNYARTSITTLLITLGVVFLVYRAITSPGSTTRMLGKAAARHAGVA